MSKQAEKEQVVDQAFIDANPEFVKEQKLKIGDKFSYAPEEDPDAVKAAEVKSQDKKAEAKKAKAAKWPVSQPK